MTKISDALDHVLPQPPPARRMNRREIIGPVVLGALISAFVAMAGMHATYKGQQKEAEVEIFKVVHARMQELEKSLDNVKADNLRLTAQVLELQMQSRSEMSAHAYFSEFLRSFPRPAWVKKIEVAPDGSVEFPVYLINTRYEYMHGITNKRFQGKTADEVYDPAISEVFRQSDKDVYLTKGSITKIEQYPANFRKPVSPSNPTRPHQVIKFYIQFRSGEEFIFGQSTPVEGSDD
ncbi:hypothetical protein GCM10011533_30360 [Streptosporangium jomthongense]|uniref:Uncharacterized protein n=1 Tax=Marinobacter aromaticivorans TaxID=1494078 RepID=A0ABW2IYW6_9GAMM|nr:hypothetical protein [Marinobacter aromaticivorans]GGE75916.1 hypothetical protein GCM10011533_30360 [Streptosporangium jomthongense]